MAMLALTGISDITTHVVVVADLRDSIGGQLAEALSEVEGKSEELKRHFERVDQKGEIPTIVMVLPLRAVSLALAPVNPGVAHALHERRLPPGHVWAVIIGHEGTTLLQPRYEPIKAMGDA
jgi:hypothetical protein